MKWMRPLALLLLVSVAALAEDWPGWLGPRRDGTSGEKIKPWKGDLKVVWRKPVGPGHSSPVIVDGTVFLFSRVPGQEAEQLTAYDANTGAQRWHSAYDRAKFSSPFGTGPQGTPVASGGKVYTFGSTGVLACFDQKSGDREWKVATQEVFKAPALTFGVACSPLIDGNNVLVNVGAKGASVVAFDRKDGKEVWKSLDDRASYSSGIVKGTGAGRQVIFLTQQGVRGFAPADGKKLWDFPLVDRLNESSMTPVLAGDLVLASSIMFGMVGLKVEKDGDGWKATQAWKNPRLTCYFSTPIPVGKKHFYAVTGTLNPLVPPTSTLHCVEVETGKILWSKPKVGKWHAALLKTADDKLLMLSDLGDLVLFEANPKEYKELARSKVVRGEQIWAHPALSNGKVYFRDEKELICVQTPE